jgi:hypothetical protein
MKGFVKSSQRASRAAFGCVTGEHADPWRKWIAQRWFCAQRIKVCSNSSLRHASQNALRIGCPQGATHLLHAVFTSQVEVLLAWVQARASPVE